MPTPAIDKALSCIVEQGISCETYREREAVRLMKTGKYWKCKLKVIYSVKNIYIYISIIKYTVILKMQLSGLHSVVH